MDDRTPWTDSRFVRRNGRTSALLAAGGPPQWIGANAAVAIAYVALGFVVSRFFAAYGLFPAPIWLPASIAVVAAMLGGFRMVPGIFVGSFLANDMLFAPPLHITAIISATNALGPAIGVHVLRHFVGFDRLFTSFRGVVAFLAATTLLAPAISGFGGTVALGIGTAFDPMKFASIWLTWMLTDGGGTLYLAPALLMWLGLSGAAASTARTPPVHRSELAVWSLVALSGLVLFFLPPAAPIGPIRVLVPFLLVVPLSWIALRVSLRSAYTLVSLLAVMATVGAVIGVGPFQNSELANPMQLVGLLVVVLAMNVLTVVALSIERQDAQAAKLAKSMLLARTSHELRTPLNAVIGFSSLIDQQALGPLANEKYLEYARIIQSSGEHLLALINDLIDLSKIDAGHYELSEETVDIATAVAEAIALIDIQAKARSIALDSTTACDGTAVVADSRALWQVLINILSNAVKFSADGGRVHIATALDRADNLSIRVADNGIGIPPEALARLGAPFERVQRQNGTTVEGSGLGLAIAKGLIALHDGTIALESAIGQGTTVTIMLPAKRVIPGANNLLAFPSPIPKSA
jgi:signal transduction histidine kinase